MRLLRLGPEARHLVTRELASGAAARHAEALCAPFLEEPEAPVELDDFDLVADELIADTARHDAGIDRRAAPAIHRALPLSRRAAADPGVWRYLAVVHRPDLVRHRWEARSWATARTRFWSPGTRHDSNALSRWWWIAELTREGGSYALTEQVFERGPLATQLFVRQFSSYRPAVAAFVEELREAPSAEIERIARELNGRLSTLVLEALGLDALRRLIQELRELAAAPPEA